MEFDGLGAETARYYYHTDHLGSVRLLTDAGGGVTRTYDYTAYGVRLDDPAAETIEYDDLGGVTDEKRYLYDGLDLVEIRDAGDATLGQIIHGPGIDNPLALAQFDPGTGTETNRYFYHTDHLGSVRLLTDAGGAVAQTYDYTAYGVRLDDPAAETTLNPFTYTGREYHAPSGLYFYRARFYDPEVGQFLSPDPIGVIGGRHLYRYAAGNPVYLTDPRGTEPISLGVLVTVGLVEAGVLSTEGFFAVRFVNDISNANDITRQREEEIARLSQRLTAAQQSRAEEIARKERGRNICRIAPALATAFNTIPGMSTGGIPPGAIPMPGVSTPTPPAQLTGPRSGFQRTFDFIADETATGGGVRELLRDDPDAILPLVQGGIADANAAATHR